MAHPQIAAFARLAEGNAQTVRRIEGQKTLLGRTQHSVSYDEIHDEIVVTQAFAGAVLTFRGGTAGEEAPIRIIQGPKTGLITPDVMSVDPVHNEYFVPKGPSGPAPASGYLHVYDRMAQGDVAPLRILGGPDVLLQGVPSVDYQHNLLLIQGRSGLYIYERMAEGDQKPLRILTGGPKSGVTSPGNPVWIPGTRNFIASARRFAARERAADAPVNTQSAEEAQTVIGVWTVDDDGDVAPRYITGVDFFPGLRTIALDQKNKTIIVSDKTANNISTWDFHEAWDAFEPQKAERYVNQRRRGPTGSGN